jgi:hypothetical protein
MSEPTPSFDDAIAEHLALQRRNEALEQVMPIDRYRETPAAEEEAAATDEVPTETVSIHQMYQDPDSWWQERGGAEPQFDWGR